LIDVEETAEKINDKDFQDLPPAPEDALKSSNKSSQAPNWSGIDTSTIGSCVALGEETVILWRIENGQLWQTPVLDVHWDFSTSSRNSIKSPTLISDTENISNIFSWSHMQLLFKELSLKGNSKSFEQLLLLLSTPPPSSVFEENSIKMVLPSEENRALVIEGPGIGCSNPFTTKSELDGNVTLNSEADSPERVTLIRYFPLLSPSWRKVKSVDDLELRDEKVTREGAKTPFGDVRLLCGRAAFSMTSMTDISTIRAVGFGPAPISTVKAKGTSDSSSNTNWFNFTMSFRQHFVFIILFDRNICIRGIGTKVGEIVAQ
jgi:hypothetical protein